MSKASEKARRYLEDSLPELRELEQKKIFSRDEILRIAKKRSDFEHNLNARGVQPKDFIRYMEWESNLDSLRQTRTLRLGGKNKSYHASQRRIFFIMERATRRSPGDVGLWIRFVDVARKQKSYKKISEILTSMVRLHPTKPEMWTFVASYAINELGDMTQARSYMQRGLRFCKTSQDLWLGYFKLEMMYIAKLAARRNILGLGKHQDRSAVHDETNNVDDFLSLPVISAAEWEADPEEQPIAQVEATINLLNTPALSGAIPMAVFDAAMNQFEHKDLAKRFFDTCAAISDIECSRTVSEYIKDRIVSMAPQDVETMMIMVRQPLIGVRASSAEYPQALSVSMASLSQSIKTSPSIELLRLAITWLSSHGTAELDSDVQKVLSAVASRLFGQYRDRAQERQGSDTEYVKLLRVLGNCSLGGLVPALAEEGLQTWPSSRRLGQLARYMAVII